MISALLVGLFTIAGVVISQYFSRKSSKEIIILQQRNQIYDLFKYAIDLTEKEKISSNIRGISILEELLESNLLQKGDKKIIKRIYTDITSDVIIKR